MGNKRFVAYTAAMDSPEAFCAGCRICELSCAVQHTGVSSASAARIRVVSWEPSVDVPVVCRQCAEAPCAAACPVDAFVLNDAKVLAVDEDRCIGCGACAEACPFGAITLLPESDKAVKCDLCGGHPKCVEVCPASVLELLEKENLAVRTTGSAARRFHQQRIQAGRAAALANEGGE